MSDEIVTVLLKMPRHIRAFMVTSAMDRGLIKQESDIHPLIDAVTDDEVTMWTQGLFLAALSALPGTTELAAEFMALNEPPK